MRHLFLPWVKMRSYFQWNNAYTLGIQTTHSVSDVA